MLSRRLPIGFALVVCLLAASETRAATIIANGTTCSLANAIRSANDNASVGGCTAGSSPGTDTIRLDYDVILSSADTAHSAHAQGGHAGLPEIKSAIVIEANNTVTGRLIERHSTHGCAPDDPHSFRLFHVRLGGSLHLKHITIRNGCVAGSSTVRGGAILSEAPLTLTSCRLDGNVAKSKDADGDGGAVATLGGGLSVTGTLFSHNTAGGVKARGGAIYGNPESAVTISTSTFADNYVQAQGGVNGGAIDVHQANLSEVVFDRNRAQGSLPWGGAVFLNGAGGTLQKLVFRDNKAVSTSGGALGGALFIAGSLVKFTNSYFANNEVSAPNGQTARGGGVYLDAIVTELSDVTFSSNVARTAGSGQSEGGGIYFAGGVVDHAHNLTFGGNRAEGTGHHYGGAMFVDHSMIKRLSHVTMKGNSAGTGGGGLYARNGSVRPDSLLATDNSPSDCHAVGGYVTGGFNFITNNVNCAMDAIHGDVTLASSEHIHIGTLGDHGCEASRKLPTNACLPTIPLLATSTILDRGGAGTDKDARGAARPHRYSGNLSHSGFDPGAFERSENAPPAISGLAVSVPFTEDGAPAHLALNATAVNVDGTNFRGGSLTVSLSHPTDNKLAIHTQGVSASKIERIGSEVRFGGVKIGVVLAEHPLTIDFSHDNDAASIQAVTALLQAITFQHQSHTPVDLNPTARLVLKDGQSTEFGGSNTSTTYNVGIVITPVNDAPSIANLHGDATAYEENQGNVPVDKLQNAIVTDHDTAVFAGGHLKVELSAELSHPLTADDKLSIVHSHGITVSGAQVLHDNQLIGTFTGQNTHTLTVALTGAHANHLAVQSLVRAIHYAHHGEVPPPSPRQVKFTLHDGGTVHTDFIGTATVTPTIFHNDKPFFQNLGGPAVAYTPGVQASVQLDADAEVRDHELQALNNWHNAKIEVFRKGGAHAGDDFEFTFNAAKASHTESNGKLTITIGAGVTTAEAHSILRAIHYKTTSRSAEGVITLVYRLMDGNTGGQGSGGDGISVEHDVEVNIAFVNDAPSIRNLDGAHRTHTEDTPAIRLANADSEIADPDLKHEFQHGYVKVRIDDPNGHDLLEILHEAQITHAGGIVHYAGKRIGVVQTAIGELQIKFDTIDATEAAVNAALRAIAYRSGNAPKTPRIARFEFNDGDGTAHNGVAHSASVHVTVDVTAVNDAPAFHNVGGSGHHVEHHPSDPNAATLDADAQVSDHELDAHHWGGAILTVKRAGTAHVSDKFGFTDHAHTNLLGGATPRASHKHENGVLTITFTHHATAAHADELVRAITYDRDEPLTADLAIEYHLSDGNTGAHGSGGAMSATPATVIVKPRVRTHAWTDILGHQPNPSKVGEAVEVEARVYSTVGTPTGTIEVRDGHGQKCDIVLPAIRCTLKPLTTAVTSITAQYLGSVEHEGYTIQESHAVHKAATNIAITADAISHSGFPVPVSVHVTSTPATHLSLADHVVVTAEKSGVTKPCGNATVSNHVKSCSFTGLEFGTWTIKAAYAATPDFEARTAEVTHTVHKIETETTILSDAPDFSLVDQSVLVHVRVQSLVPHTVVPVGHVDITDSLSGTQACRAFLTAGSGSCTLKPTTPGHRMFTATYAGDAHFATSQKSEAHEVRHESAKTTEVAITAHTPTPSFFGGAVKVSFQVKHGTAAVSAGRVTVWDRAGGSCTADVSAGFCNWTPLDGGDRKIFAMYHGTGEFAGSVSTDVTHRVDAASTVTTIESRTPSTSATGEAVRVEVKVTSAPGVPEGTAIVVSGSKQCTATLGVNGSGSCNITFTDAGSHTITATYQGNARFLSTAAQATHTVTGGSTGGPATGRKRGDVNGNGEVTSFDASLVLQHVIGKISLTADERCAADFDGTNGITSLDASKILSCAATKCSTTSCN